MLIVAAALSALIMVGGIVDIARLGRERFEAAGTRRWRWVLLIISFGPLAVLLYAGAMRPQVTHPERYADQSFDAPAGDSVDGLVSNAGSAAIGEQAR